MKKTLSFLVLAMGCYSGGSWAANGMQCTIRGCTDGEIRVVNSGTNYGFEFFTKNYLTNPVLDEFSEMLRKAKVIHEYDRVDHLSFEMDAKLCTEVRGDVGPIYCKGLASYMQIRVRENEQYVPEKKGHQFHWKTVFSNDSLQFIFELNTVPSPLPEVSRTWALGFGVKGDYHAFFPVDLYQCVHN